MTEPPLFSRWRFSLHVIVMCTRLPTEYDILAIGGCVETQKYSDAARRIADEMTLQSVAGSKGCWCVFRLSDGTPADHVPYPTRREAVQHMRWDRDNFLYLEISPDGMFPKEAEAVLKYARFLHDQGWRLPDPDFEFDASMPQFSWDRLANARHLISGGKD